MNTKTITNHQLLTVTAITTLGGSVLVVASSVTGIAKQDAWMAGLLNIAYGSVLISMFSYLGSRYPGLTLIGIIQRILGKWIGLILGAGYVFFFFITAQQIPWYVGSFFGDIMHETPPIVLILVFIVAASIAILYGIETFARATELFYIIITVIFILSVTLVLPNVKIGNVLPIFENGFFPILKSSVLIAGYTTFPVITMLMIYPVNANDVSEGRKAILRGFWWANLIVFTAILAALLVLGVPVVSKSMFPTVLLAREINIGKVITRFEYIISIMWTISELVIEVLYFYAAVKGLSEIIGLKKHKMLVIPMGLLLSLLALKAYPDANAQAEYVTTVWIPFVTTFGFIFPLLLFAVHLIKNKISQSRLRKPAPAKSASAE